MQSSPNKYLQYPSTIFLQVNLIKAFPTVVEPSIQVEDKVYNLGQGPFMESKLFEAELARVSPEGIRYGQSEKCPLVLRVIKRGEFEDFMEILFAR
jgi:hypothetical protein